MQHMARSYSLDGTGVDRQQVRQIAYLASCDERSVIAEILAQLGKGNPVRGMVGERVRNALKAARLPPAPVQPGAARKKVAAGSAERA